MDKLMSISVFKNIRKFPSSPMMALVCIAAMRTHRSLVRMARAVRVRRIVDVVPPCYLSSHDVLACALLTLYVLVALFPVPQLTPYPWLLRYLSPSRRLAIMRELA